MKWLTITSVPTASTLWQSIMQVEYFKGTLNDRAWLKAWKYACVAQYMVRRGIRPRRERWNQRNMLHQCADAGRFKKKEDEVKQRGLIEKYGIEVTLQLPGGKH